MSGLSTDYSKIKTTELEDTETLSTSRFDDGWLPDKATDLITADLALEENPDYEKTAKEIFRQNLPRISVAMVHIAMYDTNSNTRLSAQKYIVDRVLGKDATIEETDPVNGLLEKLKETIDAMDD